MRVARYFPLVIVTGLVCEATVPFAVRASDSAAFTVSDQPSEPQPTGRYVDGAVQQANYYEPRSQQTPSPPKKRGSLFGGETKSKSWFGRQDQPQAQSPSRQPASIHPQVASAQPMPKGTALKQPRVASQTAPARRPTQQPVANGRAPMPMAINNQNNFRVPSAQPPIPIQRDVVPQPMPLASRPISAPSSRPISTPTPAAASVSIALPVQLPTQEAKPAPNSSPVSPWPTEPAAATGPADLPTTSTRPTGAPAPADRLVAQAHTLSTSAKTEQEFSQIIETCRRAQASQISPEVAAYANNLTAWSLNRRGQLKAEAGKDREAILDFDDAVRADSTCWRAAHNRGVLLAQAGQFERAFDDFAQTIKLNPQFAKAYSNRAALFMVANNLKAAHSDYKRAIELDPNLAVAHRGCGRVCQLLNRLDDAVLHYDAAVQLAPNDAYAAACRADLLTDIGRYSDAVAEYNRALEVDPKSGQANCGSAWLLATCPDSSLRNPALALERARLAIELSGEADAVSYDSLAAAQAALGDFTGAMESIRKAIELAPADERDAYKERQIAYQQAKPYRIAPVDRMAQQASYETK